MSKLQMRSGYLVTQKGPTIASIQSQSGNKCLSSSSNITAIEADRLDVTLIALSSVQFAVADDDFYGIIENHSEGKVGEWIIAGSSFEVTLSTDLDEDKSPFTINACAEVEIDNEKVEEIESEPARKWSKYNIRPADLREIAQQGALANKGMETDR